MLTTEMVEESVNNAIKEFSEKIARIKKIASAVKKVEEATGLSLAGYYGNISWPSFHVKREDLPKIRKVVGRVKVTSKDVPNDYNEKHELIVRISPIKEEFEDLMFSYRTTHRGGKCHVETNVSTYQTLVCTK